MAVKLRKKMDIDQCVKDYLLFTPLSVIGILSLLGYNSPCTG